MFPVKIECPRTHERVEVDIEMGATGLVLLPPYASTVVCPSCNREHKWRSLQVVGIVPPLVAGPIIEDAVIG